MLLAERLQFDGEQDNFVQIVNIANSHWVCVSNIGCPSGVVDVYDSIPHYSTGSYALQKQLAAILHTNKRSFTVCYVNVQRQSGSADCGLFAITFAHTLCCGEDLHMIGYAQTCMRQHLAKCFRRGEVTSFPTGKIGRCDRKRYRNKEDCVNVYCICRLPWSKSDVSHGCLVQCSQCSEWFHENCENIPHCVFQQCIQWFCSYCK